jgi:hypothetical protein
MKRTFFAGLIIATSTVAVVPSAFASGYGPAPFYRPNVGAPASQRGESSQTLAVERMSARDRYAADVGGVAESNSESGDGMMTSGHAWLYRHH